MDTRFIKANTTVSSVVPQELYFNVKRKAEFIPAKGLQPYICWIKSDGKKKVRITLEIIKE